ncbi:uncharacterized protein LDX57_012045 [Aspergillus melleus]|uniref:uncharacterized protein n=1 Tax=Aspergillus melleus TaxID=138277 RepID=UPI001E8E2065|nr:uncharacterized protein LDX57_012045 [Aspergillus melleus]KAH8434398.1 hypothetical protein LDX57_012045 [Aspergillus melleus]
MGVQASSKPSHSLRVMQFCQSLETGLKVTPLYQDLGATACEKGMHKERNAQSHSQGFIAKEIDKGSLGSGSNQLRQEHGSQEIEEWDTIRCDSIRVYRRYGRCNSWNEGLGVLQPCIRAIRCRSSHHL